MNKLITTIAICCLVPLQVLAQEKIGNEIGVWDVENGQLMTNANANFSVANNYWKQIYNILPSDLLDKYVVSLRLFTDGRDEDLGGMNQMNDAVKHWQIDLDTADMRLFSKDSIEILDYTHTLVHEFGHLLSLNSSQIQLTDDEFEDCAKGYLTTEGYAIKGSYLEQFVEQFWSASLLHEWRTIDRIKKDKRRVNRLYKFYLKHSDDFLSDYAAESPEEDIAESWTFFVLSDKPKQESNKYKKVLFFYQFPQLVEYRKHIRSRIQFIPDSYVRNYNNQAQ
jgi:hypothetical protein